MYTRHFGSAPKVVFEYMLINPRHLAEHCYEFEVAVTAQEMNFAKSLSCGFSTEFFHTIGIERHQGAVASRYVAIKSVPEFVEFAGCRCRGRPYFHRVIAGICSAATAFETVIGCKVSVGPQVEGIAKPAVAK